MTKTKRIMFGDAFAGLVMMLASCASTSELISTTSLKAEEMTRGHEAVGSVNYSRKQPPELNKASGLTDYLAYAALRNPQLEAAFNRWKEDLLRIDEFLDLSGIERMFVALSLERWLAQSGPRVRRQPRSRANSSFAAPRPCDALCSSTCWEKTCEG